MFSSCFFVATSNDLLGCHDLDLGGPHPFFFMFVVVGDLLGRDGHVDHHLPFPLFSLQLLAIFLVVVILILMVLVFFLFLLAIVGDPLGHVVNIFGSHPFFLMLVTTSNPLDYGLGCNY